MCYNPLLEYLMRLLQLTACMGLIIHIHSRREVISSSVRYCFIYYYNINYCHQTLHTFLLDIKVHLGLTMIMSSYLPPYNDMFTAKSQYVVTWLTQCNGVKWKVRLGAENLAWVLAWQKVATDDMLTTKSRYVFTWLTQCNEVKWKVNWEQKISSRK